MYFSLVCISETANSNKEVFGAIDLYTNLFGKQVI